MKKISIITIISIFLITFNIVNAAFCCTDGETGQERCYLDGDGECCGGYWYPCCHGFEVSISGPHVLRIGQKTPITIYIENTGAFTDTYDISIEDVSDDRIIVDLTDADSLTVGPGQTRTLFPRVTILAPIIGSVTFRIGSIEADYRSFLYEIFESDDYLSLPEFTQFSMGGLMLLIGIIYFLRRQRYSR
jgi:hypothetical protein